MPFNKIYNGKRVLVTGHTGFKGSWLCEWLLSLGAEVTGIAMPPDTSPSLFEQLGLSTRITHLIGDIRNPQTIGKAIAAARPQIIFHLAAQPLVRASYIIPRETYETNLMGTVNLLDAVRVHMRGQLCAVVVVSTDKCYENREDGSAYRENDALGGHDPYSASKGAAEIAVASYRRSYFMSVENNVRLASARAGNVIGGGDWAPDRLVPDCARALARGAVVSIRNGTSVRPWQHVLEPISGYLWLAACLYRSTNIYETRQYAQPFNFGPSLASNRTVTELVEEILRHWPGRWEELIDKGAVHEAKLLNLSIDNAKNILGWRPVWGFASMVEKTVSWYRLDANNHGLASDLCESQINCYVADAKKSQIAWSV